MFGGTFAVFAQYAQRVGVVNHYARAVFFSNSDYFRDFADVAAHREHAVGYYKYAGGIGHGLYLTFQVRHIRMVIT